MTDHTSVRGSRNPGGEELATISAVTRLPDEIAPPWLCSATVAAPKSSHDAITGRISQRAVSTCFGDGVRRIALAHQVHGTAVRAVTGAEEEVEPGSGVVIGGRCDGLWTSTSRICLVIRTADCAPLVIWDRARPRVAVVHSGWRGTLGNILGEAIRTLLEAGSRPGDLGMWVGPLISSPHFEVGPEVCQAYEKRWPDWSDCWRDRQIDLTKVLWRQWEGAGLARENASVSGLCTFSDARGLPSHRREGGVRTRSLYTLAFLSAKEVN